MYSNRVSPARQEPFDAIPLSVQSADTICGNAKRLYAALCSAQRMGWQPTYAELADRLGASTRSVVRWVQQLAVAGLIAVRRRGQGLANVLTVLGLVAPGSDRPSRPRVTGWQTRTRSPSYKEEGRRSGYIQPRPPSGRSLMQSRYGLIRR